MLFTDNNLCSLIQLSKLECLTCLQSLSLESNDISNTTLCRAFIVYRFPQIMEINGTEVSESDRLKARQQFQHFDKILSSPNLFSFKVV